MKPLLERVEARLRDSWHGHPSEIICLRLIEYLDRNDERAMSMLTLSDIVKISGKPQLDDSVIAALAILSNFPEQILTKRFLYMDENDENEIQLDEDQVEDLIRRGDFYHPILNKRISGDFVVPIFEVSDKLKDSKNS